MGIINTVLGLVSIIGSGLIVSKTYQLYFTRRNQQRQIAQKIANALEAGSEADALEVCQQYPNTITSLMAKNILTEYSKKDSKAISDKMNDFLIKECNSLEAHLGTIALLGNLAALSGVIGTFSSFFLLPAKLNLAQNPDRAKQMAESVSLAMSYVGYGLGISVLLLVSHSILNNRANMLTDDLSKAGLTLFSQLTKNKE